MIINIASYPPNIPRPSIHDAARHINEEARLVLASLRVGPPYIARGELAIGLRELRALIRGRFLDANVVDSNLGASDSSAAATYASRDQEDATSAQISVPGEEVSPTHAAVDSAEVHKDGNKTVTADKASKDKSAPQEWHHQAMPPASPPTPHSVPPSSPSYDPTSSVPALSLPFLPSHVHQNQPPRPLQGRQRRALDPGAYAAPFLAVIVDPRAAGPHTLVALRALHRLLERGSIVQLTSCGNNVGGYGDHHRGIEGAEGQVGIQEQKNSLAHVYETSLEPIARGVLACRFEQTDAGADEAVEMAIADLLKLLVELDAAGAGAAEDALLRRVPLTVMEGQTQQLQPDDGELKISVQRLPSSVIMEAFQVVFVTRHTFVRDGGGHHSPALSFHFEQVLMRMTHVVFGGEDSQSTLKNSMTNSLSSRISSGHLSGARKILKFLIDSLSSRNTNSSGDGGDKWNNSMMVDESVGDNGRTLCLRLIQCCLITGWGSKAAVSPEVIDPSYLSGQQSSITLEEDEVLLRLIEDDLCLALLRAGQAPLAQHDSIPSSNTSSSSSSGADVLGDGQSTISLELLSQVCATFSHMWSLPKLRPFLTLQFESVFSGFYQRALSLLRRRPLPADGIEYQANMIFDMEVEVILESLVDVLCLSSRNACGTAGKSMSTIDELFGTYDCSMTESDVASGLLAELCRCCGGLVDEDGEPYLSSTSSRAGTTSAPTPRSNDSESKSISPMLIARHRAVPDHLKELCFEALIGCIRCFFKESLAGETFRPIEAASSLRKTKNKKRILHHAARLFNEKPKMGLKYLAENGMLSNPPDPQSVAKFLRNGLVVGLSKSAVGQYLGEVGKSAKDTDADTPVWDQDWFHKELLTAFCSSFGFENQTVLDGLRMFLSTFRLPGEAQMIDRILQAFAESIACQCEESMRGSLKLFSADEKRASDTAYLLSFSIIILNTDLHNENIKANRRMKLADFIRNNKNYGKDISDGDLPEEYLEGIYRNIKEAQIRTLGEGADGSMTVERWKDVMRSAASFRSHIETIRAESDVKDQKELLLECVWRPILSAVSGLWGIAPMGHYHADIFTAPYQNGSVSGARLGIDLAYEIFSGAFRLRRPDVFQEMFTHLCYMTGLLGEYNRSVEERSDDFINTIERQSAFTLAINITEEYGDLIGLDGWKCVWAMLFELRDLKLLSGKGQRNILKESDPDMLSPKARLDFCRRMANLDSFDEVEGPPRKMSLMNFVFGSSGSIDGGGKIALAQGAYTRSTYRKEDDLIWDDLASSDEENERSPEYLSFPSESPRRLSSIGASFERQLMYESSLDNEIVGVTGLERIDVSLTNPNSTRARVRQRLSQLVNFDGLIAESRYLSEEGLSDELNSLVEIICDSSKMTSSSTYGTENNGAILGLPLSPASEAFAEILLCEIALKNRDRFALIWETILRAHYNSRLTYRHSRGREHGDEDHQPETIKLTSGIEKCVTGILRLCVRTSNRNMISNEVLSTLKILHPPLGLLWSPLELNLDKHLAEGLWRVVQNVDGLAQVNDDGWSGILGLAEWCATRGGLRSNDHNHNVGSLAEDDPSLQTFRSLHLILHAVELKNALRVERWPQIVRSVRCLVEAGERGQCPKLSIAGLDLLQVLHTRMDSIAAKDSESQHLLNCWLPILEAISEPAEKSRNGSVRQQAISLLTDTLLDKNSSSIPVEGGLCGIMNDICIPLAGKRITDLLRIPREVESDLEETFIEVELCISLLFKPFLHHLKALVSVKQEFFGIWISMLGIMKQLLGDEIVHNKSDSKIVRGDVVSRAKLFSTTKEVASEHLRNAVMVLAAMGVLIADGNSKSDSEEISSVTWAAIGSIGYCKPVLDEWRNSACQ